jgi:hypothetical protein
MPWDNVVKFPHSASRRVHSRRPRTSKNCTPGERAARAAADAAKAVARKNPDPAFTLIAEKLAADLASLDVLNAEDATIEAQDNSEAACNEANWRLATTPPTTLAGVAAVLRFANEMEDAGFEWPDTVGPEGWHYQLRATMAVAIEALIKAPAM